MTSLPRNNDPELASGATSSQTKTIIKQLTGSGPSRVSLPPQSQKQHLKQTLEQKPAPETLEKSSESLDLERCSTFDKKIKYSPKKKMGVVRLRLARFGRKNAPFYRIHAADSRSPRDGKFLERIGYYDPRPGKDGHKRIAINFERAKYWLSVGAQPSDVVRRIFFVAGLLPRPPLPQMPRKGSYSKGNEGVGLAGILDGEEDDIDEDELEDHAELV